MGILGYFGGNFGEARDYLGAVCLDCSGFVGFKKSQPDQDDQRLAWAEDLPKLMLQEDAGRAPGSSAAKFRGGGEDQRREGKARWFLAEFLAKHFYTLGLLGQIRKVVGHVHSQ